MPRSMNFPFAKAMFKRGILAVGLIGVAVAPRPATAVEPLTAAVVAAQLAATVLELFTSGADPVGTQIGQNRIMIEALHERLNAYDSAFTEVLTKLDDLPRIIRKDLERVVDRKQRQELMAAVQLVLEDVEILDKGGHQSLFADAAKRLQTLQQEARELMEREDDLNIPYIIMAMMVEKAFILALSAEGDGRAVDWDVRKRSYLARMTMVDDPERKDSLYSRYHELYNFAMVKIRENLQSLDVDPICNWGAGPSSYNEWVSERLFDFSKSYNEATLYDKFLTIYKSMMDHARHVANHLQYVPVDSPPHELTARRDQDLFPLETTEIMSLRMTHANFLSSRDIFIPRWVGLLNRWGENSAKVFKAHLEIRFGEYLRNQYHNRNCSINSSSSIPDCPVEIRDFKGNRVGRWVACP